MSNEKNVLPPGWYCASSEDARVLMAELAREIRTGHLLYGKLVRVIAHRNGATDDILVQHCDDSARFTVVHLTWKQGPEIDARHPAIECDGTFAEFIEYEKAFGGA